MNKQKAPDTFVLNPDGTKGFSNNPITGCLNGCSYCYAKRILSEKEALRDRYLNNTITAPAPVSYNGNPCSDPFYPRFWPNELIKIQARKKASGIFLCDMGELFGDWVPRSWQDKVFDTIRSCPNHRFYLLTKQPQNLVAFSPFPDNCWVGVTATDDVTTIKAITHLRLIQAKVKYIFFSPLLGGVNTNLVGLDWGIIAAQNNPYIPPNRQWVVDLISLLDQAHVKVFLKDNLYWTMQRREIPVK
jgi:protein gp37